MHATPPPSWLKLLASTAYVVAWPALLLWLSGDWHWTEGWIFGVWFVSICAVTTIWLYRNDPALLAERYRRPGSGGQSSADRRIVYALVLGFIVWIVVPPLDARRFGWSPRLPLWVEAGGAVLLLG